MSISHLPTGADEVQTTPPRYEGGKLLSGRHESRNGSAVNRKQLETGAKIQELSLPDPTEAPTDLPIQPPRDEFDKEIQEQPAGQSWFDKTFGMTAIFYQKCKEIYGEGKGDPAAMQNLMLEVEKYLSFGLATIRKPQKDLASSFDPIAQCRSELTRLYEYASVLHEELLCDTEEMPSLVDKKTRAAQDADRDVEVLRGQWEKQGWGKLNPLKEAYTLMTWRGLQFDEKKARTDAYNARYQALVLEEQSRLLQQSKKEDALKMVKSGISRMQWHYEAAQRADSRRVAWEEERKNRKEKGKGLFGGIRNMWRGFGNDSLMTLHGIDYNVGGAYEEELWGHLKEVEAEGKFRRKTTTAA